MQSKFIMYGGAQRSTLPAAALGNPLIMQAIERGEAMEAALDREFGPERGSPQIRAGATTEHAIRQQTESLRRSIHQLTDHLSGGKRFADLTPIERHRLKLSDPELYALQRREWCRQTGEPFDAERTVRGRRVVSAGSSGQPPANGPRYEELTNGERLALGRTNPEAFQSLRSDWVKRGEP
jgi:hypothetical protein